MTHHFEIVKFTKDHIPEGLDLLHDYKKHYEANFPKTVISTDKHEELPILQHAFEEGEINGYTAIKNGKVIGCAVFEIIQMPHNFESPECLYIYELMVKKDFTKRGIGKDLLKRVKEYANTRGIDKILFESRDFETKGINFYKKQGFQDYSRVMVLDV